MPIEDSTVEWDQRESPYIKVATIHIPRQTFDSAQQMEFAENLSFAPWHALPDMNPSARSIDFDKRYTKRCPIFAIK